MRVWHSPGLNSFFTRFSRTYLINHIYGEFLDLTLYFILKQRTGRPRPYEEQLYGCERFVFMRYTVQTFRPSGAQLWGYTLLL